MVLWGIRGLFLLVWSGVAVFIARKHALSLPSAAMTWTAIVVIGGSAVAVDAMFKRRKISVIAAVIFGVTVGIILSWFILLVLVPLIDVLAPNVSEDSRKIIQDSVNLVITSVVCYLSASFVLQTKDDFRFVIPYVEFTRDIKGNRPVLIDTSVLIDGRIADLAECPMFDNPMVVPTFVMNELQMVADSSDKLRRNRGRRGLDILNRLRNMEEIDLQTNDVELPEFAHVKTADQRLVLLAKHMSGKIVTNDFNLNKLARAQGIPVLNLNDIANAMKPVVLPGEQMDVRVTKAGDQPGQGVGYLDDGTMVVVEDGRNFLSEEVRIEVTSVLQKSAGRMIFGRITNSRE